MTDESQEQPESALVREAVFPDVDDLWPREWKRPAAQPGVSRRGLTAEERDAKTLFNNQRDSYAALLKAYGEVCETSALVTEGNTDLLKALTDSHNALEQEQRLVRVIGRERDELASLLANSGRRAEHGAIVQAQLAVLMPDAELTPRHRMDLDGLMYISYENRHGTFTLVFDDAGGLVAIDLRRSNGAPDKAILDKMSLPLDERGMPDATVFALKGYFGLGGDELPRRTAEMMIQTRPEVS